MSNNATFKNTFLTFTLEIFLEEISTYIEFHVNISIEGCAQMTPQCNTSSKLCIQVERMF